MNVIDNVLQQLGGQHTVPMMGNNSPTIAQVLKFIHESAIQAPAQFGAGLGLSARNAVTGENNSFYQPDNPVSKFLLGNQPVKNMQGQGQDISQGAQQLGVPQKFADQAGMPATMALGALNVLPGGGAKKKGLEESATVIKNVISKVTPEATKFGQGLQAAKKAIPEWASNNMLKDVPALAMHPNDIAEVKAAISLLKRNQAEGAPEAKKVIQSVLDTYSPDKAHVGDRSAMKAIEDLIRKSEPNVPIGGKPNVANAGLYDTIKQAGGEIKGNNVVLYRGNNRSNLDVKDLRYGDYLSSSAKATDATGNAGALSYGSKVHRLEIPLKDVKVTNGEFQYIGNSSSLQGGKYPTEIYKAYNDANGFNTPAKEIDRLPLSEIRDFSSGGLRGGSAEFDKLVNQSRVAQPVKGKK